jgi:hypothetical protein
LTTERWRALQWFADHAADINAVMGRRTPSGRMRQLMRREGQLTAERMSFGLQRYVLSDQGKALLASKYKRSPGILPVSDRPTRNDRVAS